MVWIAQGVDFSTPCRQRLITFKPLTSKQKYKAEFPSAKSLETSDFPLGIPVGEPHTARHAGSLL
ncbi:MAG: hypothetical protein ACLSAX_12220, partial [Anaerotignum sp.]|uniref:hypothetical protein n=1 Tax=Anaerotignum sp. TaxID=2039241 RepID=UPI0039967442